MSPAQRIDRDAVVAATFGLLDQVGPSGLTMRALGERLGVQAASVYHHVSGRDELLQLVADRVAQSAVEKIPTAASWRLLARGLADGVRAALQEHPGAVQIVAAQEISSATFEGLVPMVGEAFLPYLDVDTETAVHILQGLYVLVVGLVSAECGNLPHPPAASSAYYDTWYEVAVETYLDGIEARFRPKTTRE